MSSTSLFSLALLVVSVASDEDEPIRLSPTTLRAVAIEYAAEVGKLEVPENRDVEGSRTIRLAVARLRSTAETPGPPHFVLPGGPGNSATSMAQSPTWKRFLELGDVVLMDPRGVGRSEPDLSYTSDTLDAALFFTDRATAVEHAVEQCRAASESLRSKGADITGYDTLEMAADVDAMRRALGYERVNLLGHSFGTHLGLAVLRAYPESVARFVSVGTAGTGDIMKLPSELDASLRAFSELVAADPSIGEAMPDLAASFARAVAGLQDEPLGVTITEPSTGEEREIGLGPFGFQFLVLSDLGDTADLPVLPRLVHSVEQRDPRLVRWFLEKRVEQFASLPILMLAVRGAAGADEARWERIRIEAETSPFGLARCIFSPEADRALGLVDVGDAFRQPVESTVPSLFVSGTLDANTPVEQAERVRAGLLNSGHVIVEFGGHEDLLHDPRVIERILAFLAGAEPEDAVLPREPLRFAPIEGAVSGFDHPALEGLR